MLSDPATLSYLFTEVDGIRYTTTQKLSTFTGVPNGFFRKVVKKHRREIELLGELGWGQVDGKVNIFTLNEAQLFYTIIYTHVFSEELCNLRKYFVRHFFELKLASTKSL